MVTGLDGGGEVADDFGAIAVDGDRMDLGVGRRDVRGGYAQRQGGQQEAGRVEHGDGHRMSAPGRWCSLKE